ncbi:hypothetical protein RB2654_14310 [Rhodobacterales bacterium HTCC2654]|uniref:Uncharacterized protein n=1 Tax=Maritimibacter alkaliphilus HTCC2654 TaxID=314271 RepID=A3VGR1_9RHOB|nr:hypothetical protein RB2654_14310 [Rhodobacterales bacterium HTCC2654] [Maritimibacter alkaliphilus HTCC2654]
MADTASHPPFRCLGHTFSDRCHISP